MKYIHIRIICLIILSLVLGTVYFKYFIPNRYFIKNINTSLPLKQTNINAQGLEIHSLKPTISNQWYSSTQVSFPSQPLYAFPLSYKLLKEGLGFSLPIIKKTSNTIFASYEADFIAGISSPFYKSNIATIGDWNVTISMLSESNKNMTFTLAQGIPYTHIHTNDTNIYLKFTGPFKFYNNGDTIDINPSINSNNFLVQINNKNYIFVAPKKSLIKINNNTITLSTNDLFVGILDKQNNYKEFKNIAQIEISNTIVSSEITGDKIQTTYQVVTNGITPIIAIFPHQYDFLNSNEDIMGNYESLRGSMKIIKKNSFTTSIPLIIPTDNFEFTTRNQTKIKNQLIQDIKFQLQEQEPASRDYTLGTWFGKIDNLVLLADTYGLTKERDDLLLYLKPKFYESLNYFHYNEQKTSLIADKPEFGNEKLNDHHFHYGYYIRTAALIAKYDASSINTSKEIINLMVKDIASTERNSDKFPFLRNFDIYEGHSWADGYASFADGNNQESSSEAIHAWYSVFLWSKIINDDLLSKNALYLYNTEIQSTYYYWFDIKGIYSNPYSHRIASIVWGGKVDFATWFSDKTNMKYGIELLPLSPGSMYLGKLPVFETYDRDFHLSGGNELDNWGDLFTIWKSFYSPEGVSNNLDKINKLEGNDTKSLMFYFVSFNLDKFL